MPDDKGFEVNDRRSAAKEGGPEGGGTSGASGPGALPPIDFVSFIGSLAATALMHLGEKVAPDQPSDAKSLPSAKQMIDLLDLIKSKTKGNLDREETDMLDNLLYNLRMRYIKETSGKG